MVPLSIYKPAILKVHLAQKISIVHSKFKAHISRQFLTNHMVKFHVNL